MAIEPKSCTINVDESRRVSGLLLAPPKARACYVLAHGAGAGMHHAFMTAVAEGLAERDVATLRYQFPYMEQAGERGRGRPDAPPVAMGTVRAAVAEAVRRLPALALFAGGKSFGGRMTSQAQASEAMPGVRGLAFIGFPLHAAGKPSDTRAKHLADIKVPLLFLQGTRDALADLGLMEGLATRLGKSTTLHLFQDADHMFHVPARSGRKDGDVLNELCDVLADWMK